MLALTEDDLDRLFEVLNFSLTVIEHPEDRDAITSLRSMVMRADKEKLCDELGG